MGIGAAGAAAIGAGISGGIGLVGGALQSGAAGKAAGQAQHDLQMVVPQLQQNYNTAVGGFQPYRRAVRSRRRTCRTCSGSTGRTRRTRRWRSSSRRPAISSRCSRACAGSMPVLRHRECCAPAPRSRPRTRSLRAWLRPTSAITGTDCRLGWPGTDCGWRHRDRWQQPGGWPGRQCSVAGNDGDRRWQRAV